MITQDNDTDFCTVRSEHLVGLYGQDTHGGDSPGGTLSTEGTILRQVDEDLLAIKGDEGCTVAKDGGKRIVTHPNTPAQNRMVQGNKHRLIREHVVGGSGVSNK